MEISPFKPKVTVEVSDRLSGIVDLYPLHVDYTSPGIQHTGIVGIKKVVADGQYCVGFIQYISRYELSIKYRDGELEVRVPVPISDGGCEEIPPEYVGEEFLATPGYPWYQPPKIVKEALGGRRDPFCWYSTSITDAPEGRINWFFHDPKNYLVSFKRTHVFEVVFVVFDLVKGDVHTVLEWRRWKHKVDMQFDHTAVAGSRVKVRCCKNVAIGDAVEEKQFQIPPQALRAPNANQLAAGRGFYNNSPLVPPHQMDVNV